MNNKNFLKELRQLNIERQKEWDPQNKATLSFKGLEFAGEAGELASKIKKLARKVEFDLIGSDFDMKDIEEEVGDVLITLDLVCQKMGVDIEKVTKDKFNATSTKMGLSTKFDSEVISFKINPPDLVPYHAYALVDKNSPKNTVQSVKIIDGKDTIRNVTHIGMILAPKITNFSELSERFKKYSIHEPVLFEKVEDRDLSVPVHRRFYSNDSSSTLNDVLFEIHYEGLKYYIKSDNGEDAKNHIGYILTPCRNVVDFLKEATYKKV